MAGLGELQDTPAKRIDSWKKGYQKGQPDIVIMNCHFKCPGFCVEFNSLTNNYQISEAQKENQNNGYYFMISNDYDLITRYIDYYMDGVRVPCKYCKQAFYKAQCASLS